jgi:hypothetical protein
MARDFVALCSRKTRKKVTNSTHYQFAAKSQSLRNHCSVESTSTQPSTHLINFVQLFEFVLNTKTSAEARRENDAEK